MEFTSTEMDNQEQADSPVRRKPSRIWVNPIFWTCFATAGSAFRDLRFEVGGMAFHPYMVPLFPLLFRALPRIHRFPGRIGRPGGLFLILFVCSLLQGHSFLVHLTKISFMALTLVIVSVSVRSFDDFVAGAIGLGACAALLCIKGMIRGPGSFGSINPIDGSQKNAFSLFYLPGLTVCLYLVLSDLLPLHRKTVLTGMIALIFAGVIMSRNRSGWLSSGFLMLLVFGTNQRRLRIVVFIAILASLAYVIADVATLDMEVGNERDAVNAAQSDELRMQLIIDALSIGIQHPLLGVSPSELPHMLGARELMVDLKVDCHNLTGYLIGGSGLLTFGAYCLFAYAMLRPPKKFTRSVRNALAVHSSRMLFSLVAIWVIRAQFQEDVLFSASFTVGLGLCIGLCESAGVYNSADVISE